MDNNRIQLVLGKLLQLLQQKDKTAIDLDLMLDYTRIIYADLLEERSGLSIAAAKGDAAHAPMTAASEATNTDRLDTDPSPSVPKIATKGVADTAARAMHQGEEATESPEPSAKDIEDQKQAYPGKEDTGAAEKDAEFQTEIAVEEQLAEPAEQPVHEEELEPAHIDSEQHSGIVLEEPIPAATIRKDDYSDQMKETSTPVEMEGERPVQFAAKAPNTKRDIRKSIGLNDRYLFQNELFDNDKFEYEAALDFINNADSKDTVHQYFTEHFVDKGLWEVEDETVQSLYGAVDKYFSDIR